MEIGAMLDELREKALKDRNIWQGTDGYQKGGTAACRFLREVSGTGISDL